MGGCGLYHATVPYTYTYTVVSLVPRPFPPPVFDRLQYRIFQVGCPKTQIDESHSAKQSSWLKAIGQFIFQYCVMWTTNLKFTVCKYGGGRPGRFRHVRLRQGIYIDTRGRCPTRNLEALSCTIGPRAGGQSGSKAVLIPSVVYSARDGSTRNGNYYCRAPPPVCLPSVYRSTLRNRT